MLGSGVTGHWDGLFALRFVLHPEPPASHKTPGRVLVSPVFCKQTAPTERALLESQQEGQGERENHVLEWLLHGAGTIPLWEGEVLDQQS